MCYGVARCALHWNALCAPLECISWLRTPLERVVRSTGARISATRSAGARYALHWSAYFGYALRWSALRAPLERVFRLRAPLHWSYKQLPKYLICVYICIHLCIAFSFGCGKKGSSAHPTHAEPAKLRPWAGLTQEAPRA